MGATHPAEGVNGLELWDDRVERMSPHIKGPRHTPKMQLRCTEDRDAGLWLVWKGGLGIHTHHLEMGNWLH